MAKAGQRKCMSCREFFVPDHRSGERQRYCCAADCRRASKAASQAAWLAKPPNTDYFSGPVHVARVQAWRAAHPGYSCGRVRPPRALQDLLPPQVPDPIEECANRVEAPEVGAPVPQQPQQRAIVRVDGSGDYSTLDAAAWFKGHDRYPYRNPRPKPEMRFTDFTAPKPPLDEQSGSQPVV